MKRPRRAVLAAVALTVALSIGSWADARTFTDNAQIQYKTAVGVVSGTGIVSGYADGSFRPKEYITREQAAKLITLACIGENDSWLPREDTGFTDVPADRWSAPYVNWCRKKGLIDGVSNGTFDPESKVTGYQFAKMLLRAVGYGQNGEYSGSSWELEAAKDGFAKGIFTGIANSEPGDNVSREDAAFYIYNALTRLKMVQYENGAYIPADKTLGASAYNLITSGERSTVYTGVVTENSANGTPGTTVNGIHYAYETGLDYLGHTVAVYTNGEKDAAARVYYIEDQSSVVTLKTAVSGRSTFEKLFGERTLSADALVYDENGALSKSNKIPGYDAATYTLPAGTYVCNGALISAYLPLYEEYGAVVGATEDGQVYIGGSSYPVEDVCAEYGSLSEGDVVLVRRLGDKLDLNTAVSMVGELKEIRSDGGTNAYIVDSSMLRVSAIRSEVPQSATARPIAGNSYRFCLDSDGAVFAVLPLK